MDKKIIDTLVKFGLITNVGVDANKYNSVDELIAKGIITVPGAESKIKELIGNIASLNTSEVKPVEEPKTEEVKPVEEPKTEEVKPVEEPKTEEVKPVEEPKTEEVKPVEEPNKDIIVEETPEDTLKKSKKK